MNLKIIRDALVTAEKQPTIDERGIPTCSTEDCRQYDGKRCKLIGHRPELLCTPVMGDLIRRAFPEENLADEDIDTMPDGPEKRSSRERSIRRWLDEYLPSIRAVAKTHGYTVAVHGSLARDVDLIAVPWIETAATPEVLANAIRESIQGEFSRRSDNMIDVTLRPHGRCSWAIVTVSLWGSYVDLSVMGLHAAPVDASDDPGSDCQS